MNEPIPKGIQRHDKEVMLSLEPSPNITPAPGFDEVKYEHHIANFKLSDDEQHQLMQAVWTIMTVFADYGFGVDPTQLICGWIEETRSKAALTKANEVESDNKQINPTFESAAMGSIDSAAGKLEL